MENLVTTPPRRAHLWYVARVFISRTISQESSFFLWMLLKCSAKRPHEVLCGPLHLPPHLRMTGRFQRDVRWGHSPASLHALILFPICFLFSDHTRARFWEATSRVPSTCPSCGIVLIRGCDCHLQCGLHNFSFKHSFFRSSAYFGGPFSSFFPFRSLRYMHVCLSGRKQRKCVRDKDLTLFFSVSSQKGLETMKFIRFDVWTRVQFSVSFTLPDRFNAGCLTSLQSASASCCFRDLLLHRARSTHSVCTVSKGFLLHSLRTFISLDGAPKSCVQVFLFVCL